MATNPASTRPAQVNGFDYSKLEFGMDDAYDGFGVVRTNAKQFKRVRDELKSRITASLLKNHPKYDPERDRFGKLNPEDRSKLFTDIFSELTDLCDAPEPWRRKALDKIVSGLQTSRHKANKASTKREGDNDEDMSDAPAAALTPTSRRKRRRESGDDRVRAKRSTSRVTPMFTGYLAPRHPHAETKIRLCNVDAAGCPSQSITSFKCPTILRGDGNFSIAALWSQVDDYFQLENPGRRPSLYIAPRKDPADQGDQIRTDASLADVLRETTPGTTLMVTLKPITSTLDVSAAAADATSAIKLEPSPDHQREHDNAMDLDQPTNVGQPTSGLSAAAPAPSASTKPDQPFAGEHHPERQPPPANAALTYLPVEPIKPSVFGEQPRDVQAGQSDPHPATIQPQNTPLVSKDLSDLMTLLTGYQHYEQLAGLDPAQAAQPTPPAIETPESHIVKTSKSSGTEKPDAPGTEKPDAPVIEKPDASVIEKPDASVIEKPDASVIEKPDSPTTKVSGPPAIRVSWRGAPGELITGESDEHDGENEGDVDGEVDDGDGAVDFDETDQENLQQQAAAAATQGSLTNTNIATSYHGSLKEDINTWTVSAKFYGKEVDDLQRKEGKEPLVELPHDVGYSTRYRLYSHQIIGGVVSFTNLFGKRGAIIEGDEMGLGKSTIIMQVWDSNYRAVAKTHNAKIISTQARNPLAWPFVKDGQVLGCTPKIGATWIMASPNGIASIVKPFVEMFSGDAAHQNFEAKWRPKLVILHESGPGMAKDFGGAKNFVYGEMTREDWSEVLPQPDWNKARVTYTQEHLATSRTGAAPSTPNRTPHPDATSSTPPATSTRFIIVSTVQSFATKMGYVLTNSDATFRACAKKELGLQVPGRLKASVERNVQATTASLKHRKVSTKGWTDGQQPMQVKREQEYNCPPGYKKATQVVTEVVELRHAALVVIDELHSYCGPNTQTYAQILDPLINSGCRPSVMAVSGTALASGANLFTTFMTKVCMNVSAPGCTDPGVMALHQHRGVDFAKTWEKIKGVYIDPAITPEQRQPKLDAIADYDNFNLAFAAMLQYYFICRNSLSEDPWGKRLTILTVKLDLRIIECAHSSPWWQEIKKIQCEVVAMQRQAFNEQMRAWQQDPDRDERNKPKMQSLARASPNAYLVARLVSCFPNLLNAIAEWEQKHPDKDRVFNDPDDKCLGSKNSVVQEALSKSKQNFKKTFIWDIAKSACRGSVKVQVIEDRIKELEGKMTTGKFSVQGNIEKHNYQTKMAVFVGTRFGRALLSCYFHQTKYDDAIADIWDSASRVKALGNWQKTWEPQDKHAFLVSWILIAATKVVSQSISMVEGHILYLFDPPPDNNDLHQSRKRQHRPPQQHDCEFNELVTVNPRGDGHMRTIESRIVKNNQGKSDFLESLRQLKATDPNNSALLSNLAKADGTDEQDALDVV